MSNHAPWLKYYGDMPHTIEYPDLTLYEMVENTAKKNLDSYAYDFMDKKTTYREFLAKIDEAARAFTAMGIVKGDRVTIALPNTPQAINAFYALNKIGAVPNMIHPLSAPAEIAFYLNFSKSKAIIILNIFYGKLEGIRNDLKYSPQVIVARIPDALSPVMKLGYALTQGRKDPKIPNDGAHITWREFIASGKNTALPENVGMSPDECAVILYSGGTTGTPKGVAVSSRNINVIAFQMAAVSGYDIRGMKFLSAMPIFHGIGLGVGIHTALAGGSTCIVVPNINVNIYANILKKKRPDIIPGVPTLYEGLTRCKELKGVDLSFLKAVLSGGDSLSVDLRAKMNKFLKEHGATVQIREGYGTTECVAAACATLKNYHRERSIGVPLSDMYFTIVRPGTTEEVSAGEDGEICLRGPSVMLGYIDNSEETAQALRVHADGYTWLHTGDMGMMDEDGFVYFKQRIKRMIVTSGYNVYPSQIENVINRHEKVLTSCVIGVKDPYKIQKVKAFVVTKTGVEPSKELKADIMEHCKKNIAKYAIPYDIEFRTELPKTLVGKVAYRVLEEEEAIKNENNYTC